MAEPRGRDRRSVALWVVAVVTVTVGLVAARTGNVDRGVEDPEVSATAKPKRFGVIGFYNPRLMYLRYQPLIDYMTERGGTPWRLVIGKSYSETVRELKEGTVDVAYLGPLTYVRAHQEFGALPVVRLNTLHRAWYRSTIVVDEDSPIRSLQGLAGGRLAFGPLLSTSSNLVPRLMLASAGVDETELEACPSFPHHDKAARAVLMGEVDAAAVRDLVGERFTQRGLRILAQSPPIPNFPLVVRPDRMSTLGPMLQHLLIELPQSDPEVRERMSGWDLELAAGFAEVDDAAYDGVRYWARQVFGPRALELPAEELRARCEGST
jgi:phosphonate transport system substrate-binding protein